MDSDRKERRGEWVLVECIGSGGQGKVHIARRIPLQKYQALSEAFDRRPERVGSAGPRFMDVLLDAFLLFEHSEQGALKVLHDPEDAKNAQTAPARFKREIEALQAVSHPALVRVLDVAPDFSWFVMEYHRRGALSEHSDRYSGNVLKALRAFEPLVKGVHKIHQRRLVHRDIKPANVFLADDDRLVLGDFGLVLDTESDGPRVTGSRESVGSRDWMPPWTMSRRVEELTPSYDVFSLGKVLWAMISGKSPFPLDYYTESQYNLERLFPDHRHMPAANALLGKCIGHRESDVLDNAGELLREAKATIKELKMRKEIDASSSRAG